MRKSRCTRCKGRGYYTIKQWVGHYWSRPAITCGVCGGTGKKGAENASS